MCKKNDVYKKNDVCEKNDVCKKMMCVRYC